MYTQLNSPWEYRSDSPINLGPWQFGADEALSEQKIIVIFENFNNKLVGTTGLIEASCCFVMKCS